MSKNEAIALILLSLMLILLEICHQINVLVLVLASYVKINENFMNISLDFQIFFFFFPKIMIFPLILNIITETKNLFMYIIEHTILIMALFY